MTQSKMKWLSPTYIGNSPYIDPNDPLKKQWNWPAIIYPVDIVPDDPLRGRLSDVIDYNVAIIATPDTFVWKVTINRSGDFPQDSTVWLGFTPSSIFIRAFHAWSWWYSEAYIDLTKKSLKWGKWVQTYCTYVSSSGINRMEDLANAIRSVSSGVTATIWLIPNWFNINVSSFTSTTLVHYIAYQ